jgi:hypothetical protein
LGFRCFAVAVQKADRLRERYRSRRNRGASARGACSGFLKDRPAISLLAMRTDGTRCPAAEHAIRRGGQARASRLETVIAARAFLPARRHQCTTEKPKFSACPPIFSMVSVSR